MRALVPVAAAAVALYWWITRPVEAGAFLVPWSDAYEPDQLDEHAQLPTWLESLELSMDPTTFFTGTLPGDLADANVRAFLDAIASPTAEGTADLGDNGYNVRFGRKLFNGYADHPRIAVQFTDKRGRVLWTSAAGRYQFMAISPLPDGRHTRSNTWDVLSERLSLPDFGPASQDAAAVELIRERGALADVRAGRFAAAVAKCAPVWASLPGAGHDQHETDFATLAAAFTAAGGTITA